MKDKKLELLLNVFTTDAVGSLEVRGEADRYTLHAEDLVDCYVDSYLDPEHDTGDNPGAAEVLDMLGRTYLGNVNRPQLHDDFFEELRKYKVAQTPTEDGCPPDCIKFDNSCPSRNWRAVGAAVVFSGQLPQTISLDLLSAWYRRCHYRYTLDPQTAEYIKPYAAFGRAMWQHYRLHCEYIGNHIESIDLYHAMINPDSDEDYAALTQALVYSICGYTGALRIEQEEAYLQKVREAAYAYAASVH